MNSFCPPVGIDADRGEMCQQLLAAWASGHLQAEAPANQVGPVGLLVQAACQPTRLQLAVMKFDSLL